MNKPVAYVSVGANLGVAQQTVLAAINTVQSRISSDSQASSLWQTTPLECPDQSPDFVNAVIKIPITQTMDALVLWRLMENIESQFGRVRTGLKNEPRSLDLDILLYAKHRINHRQLIIPHPRMTQRAFVLKPLLELDPHLKHPITGLAFSYYLDALEATQFMRRLPPIVVGQ